jgi:hypothetical protein
LDPKQTRSRQLLFTTHNTEIMDILGRYRTYLVQKVDNESFAYRLDEVPGDILRNDRPISPAYNDGKIGALSQSMSRFPNARKTGFLANLPDKSLDDSGDDLTTRCKFNFSYFDVQPCGQDWRLESGGPIGSSREAAGLLENDAGLLGASEDAGFL